MTLSRRQALASLAALAAPSVFKAYGRAPSETVLHASFGAGGMAGADIGSLTASKNLKLVAVADVDLAKTEPLKKRFPDLRVYSDWRELLDKEKKLDSCNVSTPDHMHAPITMSAMQRGIHVYTQKPLTQTIYESRQLTKYATDNKIVSQMGIQLHSASIHRSVVATIQSGVIGDVKEVHSWSGKFWGDKNPQPKRVDPIPKGFDWDAWLGVAADRPFIKGYYHPGEWRKRLDFGTGTFGDMGCHILDPVFASLALTFPLSVISTGGTVGADSWGIDAAVEYVYPKTKFTTETLTLKWYDGSLRPDKKIAALVTDGKLSDQGSIYIGTKGVMYSPYGGMPVLKDAKVTKVPSQDHYLQFVEAVRGKDKTSAPFSYAGPLTELVLIGCLATRFPKQKLEYDAEKMTVKNVAAANAFVRRTYRKGWEVKGL